MQSLLYSRVRGCSIKLGRYLLTILKKRKRYQANYGNCHKLLLRQNKYQTKTKIQKAFISERLFIVLLFSQ